LIVYHRAFPAYEAKCFVDIELQRKMVGYKKNVEILFLEDPMSVKHGWLIEDWSTFLA
jgi:hypothetical protein